VVDYERRDRSKIGWHLLPWRLVAITLLLFLVVRYLQQNGWLAWLTVLAGKNSTDLGGLLRLSGTTALWVTA
jgi:hypothetical protein